VLWDSETSETKVGLALDALDAHDERLDGLDQGADRMARLLIGTLASLILVLVAALVAVR